MQDLVEKCDVLVESLAETFPDAKMAGRSGAGASRVMDHCIVLRKHSELEYKRCLGIPLDPNLPDLPVWTLPDELYDKYMQEIREMKPAKRKNWKGHFIIKTQRTALFWDPKLERISAEGRYIVKLQTWKRAQKVLKSGDAVISTTVKGVNTMKLDEASTSADAVDTEVVMEELSFMSMKHKPRMHKVSAPAPGTRKMGK